ncbi:GntR family transcriptional regulator [Glaciibacter psychrotolerans]|uniref:DNA-binding GntR family transcriptional regulator n=1 Tax=Glaciibacter psychrotolerans TaxID=670054 RepID=A0A7Z0EF43_9MICO|nr:GntR family transcriptional regulator [Leifsonia psychrotolerans]NYJ20426.1 DNA-binding GntR family transcriptional regulator [Leifsonia psychrotolerans]
MLIERKTLREQVRTELLNRIRTGAVVPGQSINEVQLAAELGVSRTPLREALIGLETEGQITSETGRGFQFARLSVSEIEELGPIIAELESLALELTPAARRLEIGQRLHKEAIEFCTPRATHFQVTTRDEEWHGLLTSACPNSRLLELLDQARSGLRRYESLLIPSEAMIARNAAEHAAIASCLIAGDLPGARRALHANWTNGATRMLAHTSAPYLTE